MGKRLALFVALLAMWVPVASGFALGLGNITMNSALNQPLEAEIELLSVQDSDLADLRIQLGSQQDFDRVGAERTLYLSKIKFSIDKNAEGQAYIKLTSPYPVTEPFLNFVVEARWPRGRVLREFTVLVDPPALVEESQPPVRRPPAVTTAPVRRLAPAQPAPRQMTPIAQPPQAEPGLEPAPETVFVKRSVDDDASLQRAPDAGGSRFTAAEGSTLDRLAKDDALSYVVRPNDTLYEIAVQLRPEGISANQMMVYLVRHNPNAFYNSNINQLKAGYVLRIDDPGRLDDISTADANAEVKRQMAEWRARKSGKLVTQVDTPVNTDVQPETDTAADEVTDAGKAEEASLTLLVPGRGATASGTGEDSREQMRQDLLLLIKALEASQRERRELKSRLKQMEEQLTEMQRLECSADSPP